jgi:hypothetical protein
MNIHTKNIVLLFVMSGLLASTNNKSTILDNPYEIHWGHRLFAQFGQSHCMHMASQALAMMHNKFISRYRPVTGHAALAHISYAQHAQQLLHIPKDRQYIPYFIAEYQSNLLDTALAATHASNVLINPELLLHSSSYIQHIYNHETVHWKYHDHATVVLIQLALYIGMAHKTSRFLAPMAKRFLSRYTTLRPRHAGMLGSIAAIGASATGSTYITHVFLSAYQEKRADVVATLHNPCAHCIREIARNKDERSMHDFQSTGYATRDWMEKVACALEQEYKHIPCHLHH